jgi:hypothetical protein
MKIKIGKLMILWGDPVDLLQEEFKARARVIEAKRLLQIWKEEDNEPDYIKEVKSYIRQGEMLLAVKTYLKEHPDDGLRNARIAVENIKSKMEINAKNK